MKAAQHIIVSRQQAVMQLVQCSPDLSQFEVVAAVSVPC